MDMDIDLATSSTLRIPSNSPRKLSERVSSFGSPSDASQGCQSTSLKRAFSSIQNHELESPPRVFGQASVTPVSQIALRKFPLARPPSPTAQTSSTSSYRVFPPPLHLPASISLTDGTDAEAPAPRIWHGETEYPGMERVVWVSELGLATEANLREVFRHSGFIENIQFWVSGARRRNAFVTFRLSSEVLKAIAAYRSGDGAFKVDRPAPSAFAKHYDPIVYGPPASESPRLPSATHTHVHQTAAHGLFSSGTASSTTQVTKPSPVSQLASSSRTPAVATLPPAVPKNAGSLPSSQSASVEPRGEVAYSSRSSTSGSGPPIAEAITRLIPSKPVVHKSTAKVQLKDLPVGDKARLVAVRVSNLLYKTTDTNFDAPVNTLISSINHSFKCKDIRTVSQVFDIVYEKVLEGGDWDTLGPRLCKTIMDGITEDCVDQMIDASPGSRISGGQLFRRRLLQRSSRDVRHNWGDGAVFPPTLSRDQLDGADEDLANQMVPYQAKERGISFISSITGLFLAEVLPGFLVPRFVRALLSSAMDLRKQGLEGISILLEPVGPIIDIPKDKFSMDNLFCEIKTVAENHKANSRVRSRLLGIIELRARNWRNPHEAPASTGPLASTQPDAQAKPAPSRGDKTNDSPPPRPQTSARPLGYAAQSVGCTSPASMVKPNKTTVPWLDKRRKVAKATLNQDTIIDLTSDENREPGECSPQTSAQPRPGPSCGTTEARNEKVAPEIAASIAPAPSDTSADKVTLRELESMAESWRKRHSEAQNRNAELESRLQALKRTAKEQLVLIEEKDTKLAVMTKDADLAREKEDRSKSELEAQRTDSNERINSLLLQVAAEVKRREKAEHALSLVESEPLTRSGGQLARTQQVELADSKVVCAHLRTQVAAGQEGLARLRAEVASLNRRVLNESACAKAEAERARVNSERASEATRRAEEESKLADGESRRANSESLRADNEHAMRIEAQKKVDALEPHMVPEMWRLVFALDEIAKERGGEIVRKKRKIDQTFSE